jgi:hypothetical protein
MRLRKGNERNPQVITAKAKHRNGRFDTDGIALHVK